MKYEGCAGGKPARFVARVANSIVIRMLKCLRPTRMKDISNYCNFGNAVLASVQRLQKKSTSARALSTHSIENRIPSLVVKNKRLGGPTKAKCRQCVRHVIYCGNNFRCGFVCLYRARFGNTADAARTYQRVEARRSPVNSIVNRLLRPSRCQLSGTCATALALKRIDVQPQTFFLKNDRFAKRGAG